MKKVTMLFIVAGALSVSFVYGQEKKSFSPMHKYVVEREIPNAGKLSSAELKGIAVQSCSTISKMKENVQWVESYVTDDKVYCVYLAESEEALRQHAKLAGFPANKVSKVKSVLDPTTAN